MKHTSWTPELVAALAEPFPIEWHQQKSKKGTFVSVHRYVNRLNELVGPDGWSMEAPVPYHSGAKLGLGVGVTILGVTKWNVGDEMEDHGEPIESVDPNTGEVTEKVVDFGSSSTNSWAQAFKRCCAYGFGLGLYLYDKDFTRQYLRGQASQQSTNGTQRTQPREAQPKCPICSGQMWDNRENKKNSKAPDYKCRNKDCEGCYWPGQWPPKIADAKTRAVLARYVEHLADAANLTEKQTENVHIAAALAEDPNAHEGRVMEGIARMKALLNRAKPLDPVAAEEREQEIELGALAGAEA